MTAATSTTSELNALESPAAGQVRIAKMMRALGERSRADQPSSKPMLALEALRALWRFLAALVRRLAARLGFRVAEGAEPTEQQLRGEAALDAQLVPDAQGSHLRQPVEDESRGNALAGEVSPFVTSAVAPLAAPPVGAAAEAVASSSHALADAAPAAERVAQTGPEVSASVAALAIEAELQRLVEHLIEQGVPENLIPAGDRDAVDLEHHVRLLAQYRQVYRDNRKTLEAQLDERLQPLCAHVYPDIQPACKALDLVKQDLMNKDARMMMYDKSGELAQSLHDITAMQVAAARVTESLSALHDACVKSDDPKAIEMARTVFARWAPDVLPARQGSDAETASAAGRAAEGARGQAPSDGGEPGGEEFVIKYVAQAHHSVQNNLESTLNGGAAGEAVVPVDDGVRKKAGTSAFAALARRGSSVPEPADWQVSHERPEAAV